LDVLHQCLGLLPHPGVARLERGRRDEYKCRSAPPNYNLPVDFS
jgi:hypothetical protein